MKLVVIVPVRGGSEGLPGKNRALLGGVPLWKRAVEQGQEIGADQVVVSTDMEEIFAEVEAIGGTLVKRPAELAQNDTPIAPVMIHALEQVEPPARVILLQATSPMRNVADIRAGIALHEKGDYDLVMSVTETARGVLKYGQIEGQRFQPLSDPAHCFANRQSLPNVYRPNGAVYVFDRDWFVANGGFETDNIGAIVMDEDRSFDIDTAADLAAAEELLKR